MTVICVQTTKNSWLKIGMSLVVVKEDHWGRYYFANGGVAHKSLFKLIGDNHGDSYDRPEKEAQRQNHQRYFAFF
jgi:hypothetical protein